MGFDRAELATRYALFDKTDMFVVDRAAGPVIILAQMLRDLRLKPGKPDKS